MQFPQYSANTPVPATVVMDTNAVLDAWWFEDPLASRLALALSSGELRWVASAAMRAELQDVLTRQPFAKHATRRERTLSIFDKLCLILDEPDRQAPLTCADPDDQCFVDLALACRASWLFSRDRALLDLAPRAAGLGCRIVPPSAWATSAADPGL